MCWRPAVRSWRRRAGWPSARRGWSRRATTWQRETMATSVQSVDTVADFGKGPEGQAKRWKAELDSAKRAEENWVKRAGDTIKRYRDERDAIDDKDRKFNILWSNVETLKPAVYSKPPVPEVSRRFDTRSQVNRVAALILERNLHFT